MVVLNMQKHIQTIKKISKFLLKTCALGLLIKCLSQIIQSMLKRKELSLCNKL